MTLLANVNTPIEVVKGISVGVEAATRAVVSGPWRGYKLTLNAEPGTTVALDPIRAIGLVGRLIEAALPRLKNG